MVYYSTVGIKSMLIWGQRIKENVVPMITGCGTIQIFCNEQSQVFKSYSLQEEMFNMELNHLKSSKAKAEKILKELSCPMDDTESIIEGSFSRADGWLVRRVLSSYDNCIPTPAKSKNYIPFVYEFDAAAKIGKADIHKKVDVSISE